LTDTDQDQDHVFGYGSLVGYRNGSSASVPRLCNLRGYRRAWNIATDNTKTLPGYKYYRDPRDKSRPRIFVTFLNLVPVEGQSVGGVVFPVGHDELASLDARERNYERQEVTDCLEEIVSGRIWTYVGTQDAEARFGEGAQQHRAVVSRAYLQAVRAAFLSVGEAALREFEESTDPPGCPVIELERVDLD
jgi:cation transport regulator ChaC